jgi:response regulator RpfG family c-di-GMP phosphodiesterase
VRVVLAATLLQGVAQQAQRFSETWPMTRLTERDCRLGAVTNGLAQTINALLRAIHERDPEWAQRLVSTADLAGAVCQQLGVPPADVARIRQAAQLHDVGKIGIPDDIRASPYA